MITLNNLISYQRDFANRHSQLGNGNEGHYFVGDPWDEVSGAQNIKYPLLFAVVEDARLNGTEHVTSMTVYVVDKVLKGLINEKEVWSDCEQIGLDFVTYFQQTKFDKGLLKINTSVSFDFVTELGDDEISGVSFKVDFRTPYEWDLCGIPFEVQLDYLLDDTGVFLTTDDGLKLLL